MNNKTPLLETILTPSETAVVQRVIVIAMSVCRPHFQLSLVDRVSRAHILYCMMMVPGKSDLRFWAKMSAILNSKWPTPKLLKNIFYQVFSSCSIIFT